MSFNLSNDVFKKYLELMKEDKNIGNDLAEKIYKSLYLKNSNKEDILNILKKDSDNNENTED